MLAALAARGLDASAVTLVDTADLLGALQGGLADAIVTSEPGASRIQRATSGAIVVQRGGNHMHFLELRVAASQYIMAQQHLKGVPRDLVRAAVGFLHPDVRISKVTAQAVQAGFDFAMGIGALRQALTFEEVFDLRILRQVEREHPDLFRGLPPIPDTQKL